MPAGAGYGPWWSALVRAAPRVAPMALPRRAPRAPVVQGRRWCSCRPLRVDGFECSGLGAQGGRRAQGLEATMESGLGGPGRDIEDLRRLCQRQVEVEVQHHDRPLVDGQSAELAFESIALGQAEG